MGGTATLVALAFLVALGGTGLMRRYAVARSILDHPNERSLHSTPTPRGGGVAIVVSFLGATIVIAVSGRLAFHDAVAIVGSGLTVAGIGFADDRWRVRPLWRLVAHFAAAFWALAWLSKTVPISVLGLAVPHELLGQALVGIGLVWLLNLYNFMDGVDGIAGVEAATVCAGAAVLAAMPGMLGGGPTLPAALAASALGFLVWNYPPARIFLGDAGSGFLGLSIGVLALRSASESPSALWSWAILLGVFVVDATVTLFRRLARGERLHEGHRTHAYQRAAQAYSHRAVTLSVGVINVVWLFPWAMASASGRVEGRVATAFAYVPLLGLALHFRAGVPVATPPRRLNDRVS